MNYSIFVCKYTCLVLENKQKVKEMQIFSLKKPLFLDFMLVNWIF